MIANLFLLAASIAAFFGNMCGALSLTFDDGLRDQYTIAWPKMRTLGLKGSFGLIGQRMDNCPANPDKAVFTWQQAAEMAADGQEMTNHGWSHSNVAKLSPTLLCAETGRGDSAIAANTGLRPTTYFYPGNRKSPEAVAAVARGRVATRTFQTSLGSKRNLQWFQCFLQELIDKGQWGITMTHGIARGYDCFATPDTFLAMLDYAAKLREKLWIAPLRDVGAYTAERDSTAMRCRKDGNTLYIELSSELDPALFDQPLTIVFDEKPLLVEQDGRQLPIYLSNGRWCVNCERSSVDMSSRRWRAALVAHAM